MGWTKHYEDLDPRQIIEFLDVEIDDLMIIIKPTPVDDGRFRICNLDRVLNRE